MISTEDSLPGDMLKLIFSYLIPSLQFDGYASKKNGEICNDLAVIAQVCKAWHHYAPTNQNLVKNIEKEDPALWKMLKTLKPFCHEEGHINYIDDHDDYEEHVTYVNSRTIIDCSNLIESKAKTLLIVRRFKEGQNLSGWVTILTNCGQTKNPLELKGDGNLHLSMMSKGMIIFKEHLSNLNTGLLYQHDNFSKTAELNILITPSQLLNVLNARDTFNG